MYRGPIDPPPAILNDPDPNLKILLHLWWYNNPITQGGWERQIKIPLPKPAGPPLKMPIAEMIFPLTEWIIPYKFEFGFRRIAIFPMLSVTLDLIKYAQYATLAMIYQIPDYSITSGLIIAPTTAAAPLAEILRVGLSVSLVPLTITTPTK